jgi:hypothetical protein
MGNTGSAKGSGRKAIALGNGTAVAQWMEQCRNNFIVLQTCVFFAKLTLPFATLMVFQS